MRLSDIALIAATLATFAAVEVGNRVEMKPETVEKAERRQLITCPLRKPDFATVMQAAMLGDGTLLVEQQTNTRVLHIKDC
ncbi:hypothetical protein EV667_4453 [Ancylobacter aquaticus]|uniref:Uncharacterized protein n=1 Tax=Ancylobacter aquaticus TaxID=100 RepID=A0A4R1HBV8_ANCAQ|nr:hypothetical protein [Ancylobacter aquaticus]TCK16679.1 hypothetical protein EV667_4453 [Ancylobacter aquaticus]